MLLLDQGSSFKDEMWATAMVLAVTVASSFYFLSMFINAPRIAEESNQTVLGLQSDVDLTNQSQINSEANEGGELSQNSSLETDDAFIPTQPPATSSPVPTQEISYGVDEVFDNDDFVIEFTNPRMVVGSSRVFKIDVVVANKSVAKGFSNGLLAQIIKDDVVVTSGAPMTLSENITIFPGEKLTFTASLPVVIGADINQISFNPANTDVFVAYDVSPQF